MLNLFGQKKKSAFGIDISDVSIKVMHLGREKGKVIPRAYADVPLGTNIITNHMIVSEEKLADNLKRAVAAAGRIDTKFAVVSVPEIKSFVRTVTLPKMGESEIDGALPWELEQDIPVPVDQVYMDWQIVSETADKLNLLVMATPKDYIDSLIDTLKLAGLQPAAFELESQATARAVIGPEDMQSAVLVLDISTMQTSFVVVDCGHLEYTSSIPVAGNAFTESIARNLGVPAAEAEKMKRQIGLTGDVKKGNIRQAILPILDNIVDEIRNIARFYAEHSENHAVINKIILCGGSSKMAGLPDYISARLNLGSGRPFGRVTLADPWVNFVNEPDSKVPMDKIESLGYATVTGLALRGIDL